MEEQFLSAEQVAEILQLKKSTVYTMIKRGDLKASRMGKQLRIAQADVMEYLGASTASSATAPPEVESGNGIIICGEDIVLDVLCSMFNEEKTGKNAAFRYLTGGYKGIYQMYQNQNYAVGCRLWDFGMKDSDNYDMAQVTRMLQGEGLVVYHLGKRWRGFYVQQGNPKNIRDFSDMTRDDVKKVHYVREGDFRNFFEQIYKKYDYSAEKKNDSHDDTATTHLIAATMVAQGKADVAVGNERIGLQVEGIEFIPLRQESFDFVFHEEDLKKKEFQTLVEIIQSEKFKKAIEALGGYDLSGIGERLL
jgi:putative molybdopterin biosynthesis protein